MRANERERLEKRKRSLGFVDLQPLPDTAPRAMHLAA